MYKLIAVVMLCLAGALAGCSKPAVQIQTTEWYKEHKAEREAVIADCLTRRSEMAADGNCQNAIRANELVKLGGKRTDMPPLSKDQMKAHSAGAAK